MNDEEGMATDGGRDWNGVIWLGGIGLYAVAFLTGMAIGIFTRHDVLALQIVGGATLVAFCGCVIALAIVLVRMFLMAWRGE